MSGDLEFPGEFPPAICLEETLFASIHRIEKYAHLPASYYFKPITIETVVLFSM